MTVIVFPGQGSQFIGMSKDFYDNFNIAKNTFDLIEESSKVKIKDIIFENPVNLLNQTKFTQLCIFCASISIYNVLIDEFDIQSFNINCMLGHSLGEYTALTAANIISIEDCAKILKIRGDLMQNAFEPNKSGMAAIIGLNCKTVEKIISENDLKLDVANDNSPFQVVISGVKNELIKAEILFIKSGAKKFILLKVSSAFHSKIMIDAQNKLIQFIEKIKFNKSNISIISNYNPKISNNVDFLVKNLKLQMSNKVKWVDSINLLEKKKELNIIEIGPGRVLTGLIKRISNLFKITNIEFIYDIEKLKNEL